MNMLFNRLSIIILCFILFFHYGKPEGPNIDQSSPIIMNMKHYIGENEKVRLDVLSNRQIIDVPDHPNPE